MRTFEIKDSFYLDGKKFQIISGSIHYFRIVPEYWRDRLEKLKNMGCNTVETYIPWNFHEPEKGVFLWDGWRDFERFFQIATELGLYIIVRPSPYICAEWELGGLPSWLLSEPGMRLRCSYGPYLRHVSDYYEHLIPKLVPYQITNGGNLILMQIENEYGYFGDDTAYLQFLADELRRLGVTVPFVTSDGPWSRSGFCAGQLEGALPTGNFGSACEWQFSQMKTMIPQDKPLMCMEFWAGWFDAWGNKKKKKSVLKINKIDFEFMVRKHNVNIYMFHGGTNFGFMNGANYYGRLTPDTTSYDYDAPLSEDGRLTKKYEAFRKIIQKYHEVPEIPLSTPIEYADFGEIGWTEHADLFENLDKIAAPQESVFPLSMEEAGQATGYLLYRTTLNANDSADDLIFEQCADRVQAFVDGKKIFTAFDKDICLGNKKKWQLHGKPGATLAFLTENLGRVNFGHSLEDQKKGITKGVIINGHRHFGWAHYRLALDESQLKKLRENGNWKPAATPPGENPAFFRFALTLTKTADTWLDFGGWGKGVAFVNGFNLGRFWEIGPQKRLYIPAPLLKTGKNEIILFETEGKRAPKIRLCENRGE